jgi:hypothetical protein
MYDNTSLWPAPTSMQRKVRVCSSFVRFENVANDATNLKHDQLVSYRNPIDTTDGWVWMTRKWQSTEGRLTEDAPWQRPSPHASSPPSDLRAKRMGG